MELERGDWVTFKIDGKTLKGPIWFFSMDGERCDIFVKEENCLYKHINLDDVNRL